MITAVALHDITEQNINEVHATIKSKGGTMVGFFPNLNAWFNADDDADNGAFIASLNSALESAGVRAGEIVGQGSKTLIVAREEYTPPLVG